MNFAYFMAQPSVIIFHTIAAILALMLGGLQLASPKGTAVHKITGYGWVSLMVFISLSSFWIHSFKLFGPFSPIHILSIITLVTLFEAIRAIKNKNIVRHKKLMHILFWLALGVAGAFTLLPGRILHTVIFG